ncbi:hypothetical protein E2C01_096902 [Portunus trituberculatus]|uniref:Uncharacterized protein n=1 Tax=Portunus trituberculatus TaxID=210409 RepID=A0A5B7K8I6_PORTR|nr:hypothetical protein [Portunus trituberculatus]
MKGQSAAPFIWGRLHLTQYLLGAESWPGRHAHPEHAETTNYTAGSPPVANHRTPSDCPRVLIGQALYRASPSWRVPVHLRAGHLPRGVK